MTGFLARVKWALRCFTGTLRDAGFIDEENSPGNRKEKCYRITGFGETAFRFFSDPATNILVKTMLENN